MYRDIDNADDAGKTCVGCGASLAGCYCAQCGERRRSPRDRRLAALLGEAWAALAEADGRLPRTLRALLLHPGALSADWIRGRRRHWISPLGLFLFANLLVFLAPPLSDFDLSLGEQVELQPWRGLAERLVDQRLAARDTGFDEVAAAYDAVSGDIGKALLIVHVPFLALALALVLVHGVRRHYLADHLVVALHAFTLFVFGVFLVGWTLAPLASWVLGGSAYSHWAIQAMFWTVLVTACLHSALAARRALGGGVARVSALLPMLAGALIVGHFAYRFVQFLVAFGLS